MIKHHRTWLITAVLNTNGPYFYTKLLYQAKYGSTKNELMKYKRNNTPSQYVRNSPQLSCYGLPSMGWHRVIYIYHLFGQLLLQIREMTAKISTLTAWARYLTLCPCILINEILIINRDSIRSWKTDYCEETLRQ